MLVRMPTALWLLPRSPDERLLSGLIHDLAARAGTTPFPPHLTVRGGVSPDQDISALLAPLPGHIDLSVEAIDHSAAFSMALYLRCADDPRLAGMRERLATALGPPPTSPPPHVSLLYGELADAPRMALARQLAGRVPASLAFDRVAVVEAASWREVGTWRIRESRPLGG
jgi:hypothetical protein